MRFLADECFFGGVVRGRRHAGQDVEWVAENAPHASDRDVLARAQHSARVLLTLDHDFGLLVIKEPQPAGFGVVHVRFKGAPRTLFIANVVATLIARQDWGGHYSVISAKGLRMRALLSRDVDR